MPLGQGYLGARAPSTFTKATRWVCFPPVLMLTLCQVMLSVLIVAQVRQPLISFQAFQRRTSGGLKMILSFVVSLFPFWWLLDGVFMFSATQH